MDEMLPVPMSMRVRTISFVVAFRKIFVFRNWPFLSFYAQQVLDDLCIVQKLKSCTKSRQKS
jgi:hypothetical protein